MTEKVNDDKPNSINDVLLKVIYCTILIIVIVLFGKQVYIYTEKLSEHVITEQTHLQTTGTMM